MNMSTRLANSFWCVSANPAIDKRMRVSTLIPGRVNRASDVRAAPGGKAAHVAMVLRTLGADPLWIGFAGGLTGTQLLDGLRALGIRVQPVTANVDTRVNLEIIDDQGGVTELLDPGLPIEENEWKSFLDACDQAFSQQKSPGIVIASGSLPAGADPGFYAKLTALVHQHGHKIFLDTSGEPLRLALSAAPDFIKPNREEAEWLIDERLGDAKSWKKAVNGLIQLGARSAIVSLGEDGFVWQAGVGQTTYRAKSSSVTATSTVGCGDATVAAFAYAMAAGLSVEKTLQLAAACGAANCLAESPGRLREADVRALEALVHLEKLA
ncbi:MAG: tagatose 6-phosphate kinase [Acidobacteriaceae bacterium]|nr:tagatose 6-phosphate kinase [Acidobacteriaceae bacterium]